MKQNKVLHWLVPVIAMLSSIAAGIGIFSRGGEGVSSFTTLHGNTVEIYGRGIYQNDTLFTAAAFRGTDIVTICLVIPLLLISYYFYRKGSLKAQIFMIGILFYFLYNGASLTFSAAFNSMFLVYTALFSASLFATIYALVGIDTRDLAERIQPGFPQRGMAIFLFFAGIGTLFLWLSELIEPILSGTAPEMVGPYTTMFTHGFDSAVITPAAVLAGVYLLQRKPAGYLLSVPILILCTLIGIVVIGQTISQTLEGIVFPVGVYIGMIGSWVVMGAFAIYFTIAYFRKMTISK